MPSPLCLRAFVVKQERLMSEKATYFNEREHQICLVARMVEDARTYWVAGGGSPMAVGRRRNGALLH